jgi:hypothetical protein
MLQQLHVSYTLLPRYLALDRDFSDLDSLCSEC